MFTAEEGPLEKRRMLNEKFYLKIRPNSKRRVQALLDLSLMFSCQIKTLNLWLDPIYAEIWDLMEILAPLSGSLRELTLTFVINNEEEVEEDIWLGINYPVRGLINISFAPCLDPYFLSTDYEKPEKIGVLG